MRKLVAMATLVLALAAVGCAGTQTAGQPQGVTKQTVVKCPACGVEFTVGEGLKAYEKAR
ncbi:MAG: hypothetical protein Kow0092_29590 [Deferrisomatales bacterium]